MKTETHNGQKTLFAKTRKQWRTWLEKNHQREKCIWLIFYRQKSKTQGVSYADAVEEALCFGWIDSVNHKRDEESHYQYFAPRKPKGYWSQSNRERVERLVKQGLMTPAGQAMIDLAKETGTWTAMEDVEKAIVPADLEAQFKRNKKAWTNYQAFPVSARKLILGWIFSAKKTETRKQRIMQTVELAAKNIRANQ